MHHGFLPTRLPRQIHHGTQGWAGGGGRRRLEAVSIWAQALGHNRGFNGEEQAVHVPVPPKGLLRVPASLVALPLTRASSWGWGCGGEASRGRRLSKGTCKGPEAWTQHLGYRQQAAWRDRSRNRSEDQA